MRSSLLSQLAPSFPILLASLPLEVNEKVLNVHRIISTQELLDQDGSPGNAPRSYSRKCGQPTAKRAASANLSVGRLFAKAIH